MTEIRSGQQHCRALALPHNSPILPPATSS